MCCKANGKRFFLASFLLLCTAILCATPEQEFIERLQGAEGPEEAQQILQEAPYSVRRDPAAMESLRGMTAEGLNEDEFLKLKQESTSVLQLRERLNRDRVSSGEPPGQTGGVQDPQAEVSEILDNPVFSQGSGLEESNWLSRIVNRLRDLFRREPRPPRDPMTMPSINLSWLQPVMYAILGLGILFLLFLLVKNVQLSKNAKKAKANKGLLSENEPLLDADEWLEQAEKYIKQGDPRRAVRALYLGSLMLLGENEVILFRRYETNWEHLYRAENSGFKEQGTTLREVTQLFDRVWYGHSPEANEAVDVLKKYYSSLVSRFKEAKKS
ncbi:MAG: DUF4129 domain-containing protein [Fimbriimonadaceae bacterium]